MAKSTTEEAELVAETREAYETALMAKHGRVYQ